MVKTTNERRAPIPRWQRGQDITAGRLNVAVDEINRQLGFQPPRQEDEPITEDEEGLPDFYITAVDTVEIEIPIYDADDPTVEIGTATATRISRIQFKGREQNTWWADIESLLPDE